MIRTLASDDVVFVCPSADQGLYSRFQATMIASGGIHRSDYVNKLQRQGIHMAATVWCHTAGAQGPLLNADLADATARDIEGKPIAVPWLATSPFEESPALFGCINNPVFRAYMRQKVCDAMAGGAAGLHIDEYLGSAFAALHLGGCFCDFCMEGFKAYCATRGPSELLSGLRLTSFDELDFRSLVRDHAPTLQQYLALQDKLPLIRQFIDFQLQCARDNVVALGRLAADIVGRPVTLSANTCLPELEHAVVAPSLSYLAAEIDHHAQQGAAGIANAIRAYRMAEALDRPLASTASVADWSFVNDHKGDTLVCLWIALSYACGGRFMVPVRMPCLPKDGKPHWYCGPVSAFVPLYGFVRTHGFLLNGFRAVGPLAPPASLPPAFDTHEQRGELAAALDEPNTRPLSAGAGAMVFPRFRDDGAAVAHVVNCAYDPATGRLQPQKECEVRLSSQLFKRNYSGATVYGTGGEPVKVPVRDEGGTIAVVVPELKLWSIIAFEYWA
jgi:hypothetical protein